jgi:hypothetical protein
MLFGLLEVGESVVLPGSPRPTHDIYLEKGSRNSEVGPQSVVERLSTRRVKRPVQTLPRRRDINKTLPMLIEPDFGPKDKEIEDRRRINLMGILGIVKAE